MGKTEWEGLGQLCWGRTVRAGLAAGVERQVYDLTGLGGGAGSEAA